MIISSNFINYQIYYAVKANSNIHIIKTLKSRFNDLGCDCSSPGELFAAKKAGFNMSDCVYTGNYESFEDLQTAYDAGPEINLDDLNSLERLKKIGIPDYISFRLNPGRGHGQFKGIITGGKDSKFGIPKEKIVNAYEVGKKSGIKKFGLQCHAGSSTLDAKTFSDITRQILKSAREIEDAVGQQLEKISIGSGFGIPYRDEELPLDIERLFKNTKSTFSDFYGKDSSKWPTLCIEPGRILVADTGFILAKVTGIKSSYKKFIGLDAGMETLMRPALYGAFHKIIPITQKKQKMKKISEFVGPICESTDKFTSIKKFQKLNEKDIVAICDVGAYGMSLSSNYNLRPKPIELLIRGSKIKVIRKRQKYKDII